MKKILEHIKELSFYNTLRHGSVYMLSFIAIQIIMVLSLPIFTKLLSPSDFGIYEVYNNTVRFLAVIVSLNLYAGFYRYYFEENVDQKLLMQFLLRIAAFAFIIGVIVILIFRYQLLRATNLPYSLLIWIPIGIFSNIILNFFTTYNNAQQFSTRLGIWNLIIQILRVASALLFVLFISRNYYGRIAGENSILFFVCILLCIIYFRKYVGWSEELPNKMQIVKYAAGFIPIGLSSYIVSYVDLVLINNLQGSTASGVYSYAYKFAIIYSGFSQAFVTANRPNLFNLLNEQNEKEVIAQMRSMFKLITVLATVFIFFAADAGKILSLKPEFDIALHLLPVLILGYVFSDIAEIYNFFLYYSKKVKLFYISFATTAIINFVLNLILIPKYGYEVAAYTTLFSFMILFATTYLVCKFYTQLTIPRWTVFINYLIIIIFAIAIGYFIEFNIANVWIILFIKAIIFIGITLFIYFDKLKNLKAIFKA